MARESRGVDELGPERLVAEAAGRLDVGEAEIFRLAHCRWFGREPAARPLDRLFAAYMFHDEVPAWVRHYAREVVALPAIGAAEAHGLELQRLPGPPEKPRHGGLVVAGTGAAFLVLFVLLLGTPYHPGTSEPIAPDAPRMSCAGGGPGLAFFEELAYALAGTAPPPC